MRQQVWRDLFNRAALRPKRRDLTNRAKQSRALFRRQVFIRRPNFRSLEKWKEPFQLGLFRPPPVFANLKRLGVSHLRRSLVAVPFFQHASKTIRDADVARGVAVADLLDAFGSLFGVLGNQPLVAG